MAYRPSHARAGADQVQINMGRMDFDNEIEDMTKKVGLVKVMVNTIKQETEEQGTLINSLEDTMERAKLALRRATQRLNVAYQQSRSNHLLYLVLFAMALFFGVYMIARAYRLGRAVLG